MVVSRARVCVITHQPEDVLNPLASRAVRSRRQIASGHAIQAGGGEDRRDHQQEEEGGGAGRLSPSALLP